MLRARRSTHDVQRLHSWRRKFATAGAKERAPGFVEFRPRAVERVEVVLRSGHVLRVAESIDTAALPDARDEVLGTFPDLLD